MPFLYDLSRDAPRVFELGPSTSIGRAPENVVLIADPMVSLRHAELRRTEGDHYQLVDLGSRHGTIVGGKRVTEILLRHGDEILLGATRLRFQVQHDAEAAADHLAPLPSAIPVRFEVRAAQFRPASDIPLRHDLDHDYERLRIALELTRAIGVEHDSAKIVELILQTVLRLFQADRAAIVLLDGAGNPTTQLARLRDGGLAEMPFSTSMLSEVLSNPRGVLTADTGVDSRFNRSASVYALGIRSAMCVPILYSDEILGVMQLDSQGATNAFTEKDLELFIGIAGQSALAIKNAALVQRIQTVVAEEWHRLERVVQALPAGVLLLDADRRLRMTNQRAAKILPLVCGASRGDVVEDLGGVSVDDLLARGDAASLDVVASGPPARIFSVSAAPAAGTAAGGAETVVVIREVTEEREQEARANQNERLALIGQLAGGIAHDFNNLLAIILNYSDFVAAELATPALREDVDQIKEAAVRAVDLTKQLLAFSRRELITTRVFDLNRLIADMDKLMRRALGKDFQFATQLSPLPLPVKADASRIEQVLLNLVVNARDAMVAGGALRVETDRCDLDATQAASRSLPPGPYGVIAVHDTGVGMAPEIVARVFEPFFTTKERGKGTGLGLATAYGTVKQVGGHIAVESRPGAGTTFRILLPMTDELAPAESEAERSVAPRGRETVLLAEDEPAVRELTRRILAQAGYEVIVAPGGEEALALLEQREGAVALLLTDLVMPGMSGKQLAERVCARRPEVRVLYMSGYIDREAVDKGLIAQVVSKPFARDELLRRVRDTLDAP